MTTNKRVKRYKSVDEMVQKMAGSKFKKLWAKDKKVKRVRKWKAWAVVDEMTGRIHYANHSGLCIRLSEKAASYQAACEGLVVVPVEIREVRR